MINSGVIQPVVAFFCKLRNGNFDKIVSVGVEDETMISQCIHSIL